MTAAMNPQGRLRRRRISGLSRAVVRRVIRDSGVGCTRDRRRRGYRRRRDNVHITTAAAVGVGARIGFVDLLVIGHRLGHSVLDKHCRGPRPIDRRGRNRVVGSTRRNVLARHPPPVARRRLRLVAPATRCEHQREHAEHQEYGQSGKQHGSPVHTVRSPGFILADAVVAVVWEHAGSDDRRGQRICARQIRASVRVGYRTSRP